MKILLTGASGFVGYFIQKVKDCWTLEDSHGQIDLRDKNLVAKSVAEIKPDTVIHLAAQSFVPESFANPKHTFDVNLFGTLNLLEALKDIDFQGRFLFVGSGDIYGLVTPESLPIKEDFPLKPRSPYAVSKVSAEALCYQWSQTEDFDVFAVRPFNHIGPGQSERFVVSDFAKQIIEIKLGIREPVLFTGDIHVSRDFTDVRDIVRAYFLILESGKNGEVYNVCSGKEVTIHSILEEMLMLSGVKAKIMQDPNRLRSSEQRRVRGDYSRINMDTGWSPQISLSETLIEILNYWETNLS